MSNFKKLRGTLNTVFQFGLKRSQIKSQATGELEVRNATDSAFAVLRAGAPVGSNDVVTKIYADSLEKPIIVSRQADTSSAIPNNTGVRGFVVVTTAGSGASIGDVLFDDGSSSGQMSILSSVEGRVIAITDALSGGSITFEPDSIYIWDEDGTEWIKIGDIGSTTGSLRAVRFVINTTATQDSSFSIPANSRITATRLEVTTSYSAGATISVGTTSVLDAFMTINQNNPQVSSGSAYLVDQDTDVGGSTSVVRVTVSGLPATGAGVVVVLFSLPNN